MGSRIIKESICTSTSIDRLSWFEEVLFYRLIVSADDYGRYDGRLAVIKGRLFSLKRKLTDDQVEKGLQRLAAEGMITRYTVNGQAYLQLTSWGQNQQIRNKRSKYPDPNDDDGGSTGSFDSSCNQVQTDENSCFLNPIQSNPIRIQSESNSICPGAGAPEKPKEGRKGFKAPTVDEVRAYCQERGNKVDAEKFVAHYETNGWRTGKGGIPMQNWKAAVITWEKNEREFTKPASGTAKVTAATQYKQREYDIDALNAMI